MITTNTPTGADVAELAANMRPEEVAEVAASTGFGPLQATAVAVEVSAESWTVRIDGDLALIWGVAYERISVLGGRIGEVWMLTTKVVERRAKTFWRLCLLTLPAVLSRWDALESAIDARHEKAVRWAKRLGFGLCGPRPIGPDKVPFWTFRVTRRDLVWVPPL